MKCKNRGIICECGIALWGHRQATEMMSRVQLLMFFKLLLLKSIQTL
jgi:hypothetical protein